MCGSLFVVRRPLFGARILWFFVRCSLLLCVVRCLSFVVCLLLFVVVVCSSVVVRCALCVACLLSAAC